MRIHTSHELIDDILDRHRAELGADLPRLRNHIYRGLNYQLLLLGSESIPDSVALAWAVHDIGIWTAGTLDYIEPSADLAAKLAAEYQIPDVDAAQNMVQEHHRLRPVADPTVETFRRADLVDVSRGVLRGSISRAAIKAIVAELPYLGFHQFLARGLTSYAVRHPARPLPMMRW